MADLRPQLRQDVEDYLSQARASDSHTEVAGFVRAAETCQKMYVAESAITQDIEPGAIAEMMALMSGDVETVIRRLVATHGLGPIRDAVATVESEREVPSDGD